mmetsp:Transcript_20155/g.37908  ORF Transcript_20155/g.37908 Transcript_20155/m.37908 type:complete len:269 (-) Transcript_20155:274-1080(-)|eukprot:CAMPEP_0170185344 /NCGR_PEP_ID=MMETSP0040_2-20121228/36318_1 /TAXON_ID=641309 /ORGANISM="Lotharella oceanica, Strain CCMP622" /LENGTH=268 /DNA_ID=CAMNT_0010431723 /DNA_START=153 /DNA_END=959 /DNA_ORIENTATION=-
MSVDKLENDAALLLGLSQLEPSSLPSPWKLKEEHFERADRESRRASKHEKRARSKSYGSRPSDFDNFGDIGDLKFSALPEITPPSVEVVRTNSRSYTKRRKRIVNRASRACAECHRRKVRCLPNAEGNMRPCQACLRSGVAEFCRNHVPTPRAKKKLDGKDDSDPNSASRPPRAPKALADHLNRHRGLPCMRNSWCNRPFKHPGHCKNPNGPKTKRVRKRSRSSPELEDIKPPAVTNTSMIMPAVTQQITTGSAGGALYPNQQAMTTS